jgi:hypothetical protein
MTTRTIPEGRFWDHVAIGGDWLDCWLWTGYLDKNGYGRFFWGGTHHRAHRIAYRLLAGDDLSDDLELDHVVDWGCEQRDCVNPLHLEPVTHVENDRRKRRDRCDKGHLITDGYDGRRCYECKREYMRSYYSKHRGGWNDNRRR